jgi:hypothetical protein
MKYLKNFENHAYPSNAKFLLCVKSTDPHYYRKFTLGKKYKIYISEYGGTRLKDDKGKFCNIDGWRVLHTKNNNVETYEYAEGIFTTDKSLEDYELRINLEKYNL